MNLQSRPFQRLVELLATDWANCSTTLTTYRRGIVPGQVIPAIPTVYVISRRADDGADKIVYIGQTTCLPNRLRQHEANARLCATGWTRVSCFVPGIDSKTTRLAVEGALILLVRPPINMAILLKLTAREGLSEIRWTRRRGKAALA